MGADAKRKSYTVIDLGNLRGKEVSIFCDMKKMIFGGG